MFPYVFEVAGWFDTKYISQTAPVHIMKIHKAQKVVVRRIMNSIKRTNSDTAGVTLTQYYSICQPLAHPAFRQQFCIGSHSFSVQPRVFAADHASCTNVISCATSYPTKIMETIGNKLRTKCSICLYTAFLYIYNITIYTAYIEKKD